MNRLALRLLWRDWRSGELRILVAALIIAAAIVTGIGLFVDRLQAGLQAQSATLLAADSVLQSPRTIPEAWLERAIDEELETALVVQFGSMLAANERLQLASIKAVSDTYPLLGNLLVSDYSGGPQQKIAHGPERKTIWVSARLLPALGVKPGDEVSIGEAQFRIGKILVNEPDSGGGVLVFGPRVIMHADDLPATGVIQPGSQVRYDYLFKGSEPRLRRLQTLLNPLLTPGQKFVEVSDRQPRIANALQRAKTFFLLAGALGVMIAGVAIALAAQRFARRHIDYVAILKTLGSSSTQILRIYSSQFLLLVILATLGGWWLGWFVQWLFFGLFADYITVDLPASGVRPYQLGLLTCLICLLSFALPPVLGLLKVSPLRVLRRDIAVAPLSAKVSYISGLLGIFLLMLWYSQSLLLTGVLLISLAVLVLGVGSLSLWLIRRARDHTLQPGLRAQSGWRLALAALQRRALQSTLQLVVFSLVIMLMLVLTLVQTSLVDDWHLQLPDNAPNHFLVNVAPDELKPLEVLLLEQGLASNPLYPMVRGRLVAINDRPLKEVVLTEQRSRDLDRELGLTWASQLPDGNQIRAGHWWGAADYSPDSTGVPGSVSVEQGLADDLDLVLGDRLEFQIADKRLEATVSSIRSVDWDSMKPNFYMIFEPGVLEQFEETYLTSFYLPTEQKMFLNRLVQEFPTVTVLEMDAVIAQIRTIVGQVSLAIELVLILILVAGVLVLLSCVQSSIEERLYENALLRALGASRALILGSLVIEFAVLGALAGGLAVIGAEVMMYALQKYLLDMTYQLHFQVWLLGPLLGLLVIVGAGVMAGRRVVNSPPIQVLREF